MIALDADEAALVQSVARILRELAGCNLGLPVGTAKVVFNDFLAVVPVLDMIAIDDDACFVPLAGCFDHARGRTVQPVSRGGGGQSAAAVRRVGVIEQLILRSAPINVVVLARSAVKDAAVA